MEPSSPTLMGELRLGPLGKVLSLQQELSTAPSL